MERKSSFEIRDDEQFWQEAFESAEEELIEVKELAKKRAKKKKRKTVTALSVTAVLLIAFALLFLFVLFPQIRYNKALTYIKEGNYEKGIEIFIKLGDYKDSAQRILKTRYDVALRLFGEEKYEEAYLIFDQLGDYSDASGLKTECLYKEAICLMEKKQWDNAKENFTKLGNYKEAGKHIKECSYQSGLSAIENEKWEDAVNIFSLLGDYKDSQEKLTLSDYNRAQNYHKLGKYTDAVEIFEALEEYEDSFNLKLSSMFSYVKIHQLAEDMKTYEYLTELIGVNYENSKAIYKSLYGWKADCIINNSKTDKNTDSQVISRFDTVYFHVTLSGGAPQGTTTVRYEITFPGGSIQKGNFGKGWKKGSEGCTWVWFKTPAYAETGYAYIKLYDSDSNLIGEDMVYIAK